MKRFLPALLTAATIGFSSGANAVTVFQNGSFELGLASIDPFATLNGGDSTSITGWSVGALNSIHYIGSYWTRPTVAEASTLTVW